VLGAEKGRGRVWGAAAPARDGRVWGALAPARDGRVWGGGVPMWRGNRGGGAVEGLGAAAPTPAFSRVAKGRAMRFFLFSCYWIGGCVWDQWSRHHAEWRRAGEGEGAG
jgi:hypothetical protein